MIYRKSYFRKELRQAYLADQISSKRKAAFALFLGLVSFAVHFVLQTLAESVLADSIPHMMQPSYFSTVYTYITIAYLLNVGYFILFYDYLSFAEIRRNRWYLLVKMGYKPLGMIFSKITAFLYSLLTVYTIGFLFTVLLTVFLKYNFVYQYLLSLYLVGFFDLIIIGIGFMTASLYIKDSINARYFIFFSAVFVVVLKMISGYSKLVSDRILMQDITNLFDFSQIRFLPAAALIVIACLLICIIRAWKITKYYSLPSSAYGYKLPGEEKIVTINRLTGKVKLIDGKDQKAKIRLFDVLATIALVIFVVAALAFNLFVILISTSQAGKEVTIRGTIPYIFKSDTMEPAIMKNDLAYFKRVDLQEEINVGDIVLFQEKKVVYVERVISKSQDQMEVDIDKYPPMSQEGIMKKTIDRSAVYGVFSHCSRWLGALILFANTIFGRLMFLLIPAFLLFFYKPIRGAVEKNKQIFTDD